MKTIHRRLTPVCPTITFLALALFGLGSPRQAAALATSRVVFIVIDGARATEFLDQPGHSNTPRIWKDLRHDGVISHVFYNLGITKTSSGHGTILTGTFQDLDYYELPRPTMPTLYEYFRADTGESDLSCLLVTYKDKLLVMGHSDHPDYGAAYGARVHGPTWSDDGCITDWLQDALLISPKVSMLALGATDSYAHGGDWLGYNSAIRHADSLTGHVWDWIQSTPGWAGATTMFVTNDHGRHMTDWMNHGDDCYGCRHIGLLAIGPDFARGLEIFDGSADLRDLCGTAAFLLGVPAPLVEGRILWELFAYPAEALAERSAARRWRLEAFPLPSSGGLTIRLVGHQDTQPLSPWDIGLFDASGRLLWTGSATSADLKHGLWITRPEVVARSGCAWLRVRAPDGTVAGRRALWIK